MSMVMSLCCLCPVLCASNAAILMHLLLSTRTAPSPVTACAASRYLKEEGGKHWSGNLFVFDSRLAVHPAEYRRGVRIAESEGEGAGDAGAATGGLDGGEGEVEEQQGEPEGAAARCQLCGGPLEVLRHRNCANADCNELIL